MKSQRSRTRDFRQQVLNDEEHWPEVCQVWKNEPHNAEPLAWWEKPKQKGQRTKVQKVRFVWKEEGR